MRFFGVAVVFAIVVGACADEPAPVVGASREAITNGADDASDPAVVALVALADPNVTLCTGTLVSPHVVLTAAHCLDGATQYVDDGVFFGAVVEAGAVEAGASLIAVSGVRVHPQYDPTTFANDLALLALASPAPVAPIPLLAPTADATLEGASVRIVGFGRTGADASDFGQKRTGTSTIANVTAATFDLVAAPSQQCFGDSGGPALLTVAGIEYLAGVTSHGDAACISSDEDSRVDAYAASFIAPFLAATADGSTAGGQPCFYEGQCASGACVAAADEPKITYCAPPCGAGSSCPARMVCTSSAGAAQCRYPLPTPGALGSPCAADADCFLAQCQNGACSHRCVTEADCPAGFSCSNVGGGIDFYCAAQAAPVGATGSSCQTGEAIGEGTGRVPWSWPMATFLLGIVAVRRARRRLV